jgi:CheY-like chemotaxis protein
MKKILVIEDDTNIATALSIRLESAGYEVLSAPDGLRGLRLARNHWPDLILLDVGLPLLDIRMPLGVGYSVARRLKAMGLGEIPIIFITASKEKGVREAAAEAGAAAFFEKPYDPEELLRTIEQVLHARTRDDFGRAPSPLRAESDSQESIFEKKGGPIFDQWEDVAL